MSQQCGVGDFYIKNKGEITMKITLKDGSSKEYSEAKSVYEPFANRFPKDTKLYALMTTKPGEGVFGGVRG